MKQGFSRRAFRKRDVGISKGREGDPHGQDGIAQFPSADHQEARSSAEQLQLFEQLMATSGCLAEMLLSWNGSSLRNTARRGLRWSGGEQSTDPRRPAWRPFMFLVGAVVEGGVAVLDGVGLLHLEDVGRGFAEVFTVDAERASALFSSSFNQWMKDQSSVMDHE